jgi:hypothetical protein
MKPDKKEYIWVDNDNYLLKGYFKVNKSIDKKISLVGRIISFFKKVLK